MMRMLPRYRQRAAGLATVEFALLAPILIVLLFSLVDIARAIQANMILINLSREAANLSVRGKLSLADNNQVIIGQVAASAPPLDMNHLGMIYITRLIGSGSGSSSRTLVQEQYRWDDSKNNQGFRISGYAPASRVWSCGNWASGTAGTCVVPSGSNAPAVSLMSGTLADGQEVYVVETFYKFDMLFGIFKFGTASTSSIAPDLYSMTVF